MVSSRPVQAESDSQANLQDNLPEFSLVIETENLSVAEIGGLKRCLESLKAQDLSPAKANEVLLIESGYVPSDMIGEIQHEYPWILPIRVPPDTGYYEAKMEGFRRVTGEVVIFCDSDCEYEPEWLRNLIIPFQDPAIQILAGETSLRINSPYSLAMALSWYMPPFSNRSALYSAAAYSCNNVAFRTTFLNQYPIPCNLGWYRGNCSLHALDLRQKGFKIWRQPHARGRHPLVKRLHFIRRFVLAAHHELMAYRRSSKFNTGKGWLDSLSLTFIAIPKITIRRIAKPFIRFKDIVGEDVRHLVYVPFAVPWIVASTSLFFIGLVLSYFRPVFFDRDWGFELRDGNMKFEKLENTSR